ncbi:MAG: TfoX/Sxy family protein [Proteobacteria bacterium]|nr:TfoX/Sxy family protein [Pseudomonadota bacterium]
MFGGAGLFLDGLMFGLITGDATYLKADAENRAMFEAEGMQPFSYLRRGAIATLTSYWRLPDRLLDEPDELLDWARASHACARRNASAKPATRSTPRRKARGA